MRKFFVYLLVLSMFSLLVSCSQIANFKVPKTVKVKAEPDYKLSLGSIDANLWKLANVCEDGNIENYIKNQISSQSDSQTYEPKIYKPEDSDGDEVDLLLEIPVLDVSINVAEYLEKVGVSDKISNFSSTQTIDVPDFKVSQTMDVDLEDINNQVVDLIYLAGSTTSGNLSITSTTQENVTPFETVTFNSGEMVLTLVNQNSDTNKLPSAISDLIDLIPSTSNFPSDVTVTLYSGTEIVTTGKMTGGKCELDLSGKTISSTGMSYSFTPEVDDYYFEGSVENGKLSKVTGLYLSPINTSFEQTVNTKESFEVFDSCTIKKGEIDLSLENMDTWKNANINFHPVTVNGVIDGESETVSATKEVIDLSGKTILPEDAVVSGNVYMVFENTTVDFDNPPVISFEINVEKLEEMTLTLDNLKTVIQQPVDLGEDVRQMVRSFNLGQSKINLAYTNTLPEGNDIGIHFVSDFLNFDSTGTLESDEEDGNLVFTALSDNYQVNIADYDAIDLSFGISLPGSTTENPNKVTLKNIEIGASYTVAIDCSDADAVDFQWNNAVLNLDDREIADSYDTGFSLSSISDVFTNIISTADGSTPKLLISEIPVYLYCVKPESDDGSQLNFTGLKLSGTVKVNSGDEDIYLLSNDDSLDFVSTLPELETDSDGAVITDITQYPCSHEITGFSDVVNSAGDSSIVIDYDINCSLGSDSDGLTIINDGNFDNGSASISVVMYVIVPCKFGFASDVFIDIANLLNLEDDIFGRQEASTSSVIANFMQYFESAAITYKIEDFPISCDGLKLEFNPFGENSEYSDEYTPQSLDIGGSGEIKISNMEDLLNVYPLIPTVRIDIPKISTDSDSNEGWILLKSSGEAKLNLGVEIKADIEADVTDLFGGK